MSELKKYTAIQDFSMSMDNGKTSIYVKRGETLEFDGLNLVFQGEKGTARSLTKVIGEWLTPSDAVVKVAGKQSAQSPRNATGGRVVEHSDYPSDPVVGIKNPPSDSIHALLKTYDKTPEVKIVNGVREVTSDLDDARKEVRVINSDDDVVRKVSVIEGSPDTNKNSVEIGPDNVKKSTIISREGQVTKETNYSGVTVAPQENKKLTIDYEASGVVFKKTSSDKSSTSKAVEHSTVAENEVEVGQTSYPAKQTTAVGSSTQSQLVSQSAVKKTAAVAKKKPVKKGTTQSPVKKAPVAQKPAATPVEQKPVFKGTVISTDGQEAVIISKVTRDKASSVQSEDGIISRVTVGASGDIDAGEVQFSSNNDYEDPVAVISSGEDTVADILGEQSSGDDMELDLNDLLSEV